MTPVINPSAVASLQNMNTVGHLTVKGLLAVDKITDELNEFFHDVWNEYMAYARVHADAGYANGFLMKGYKHAYCYDDYTLENKGTSVQIAGYWSNQSGGNFERITIPVDSLITIHHRKVWFDAHFAGLRAKEDTTKALRIEAKRQEDLKKLAALKALYPEAAQ